MQISEKEVVSGVSGICFYYISFPPPTSQRKAKGQTQDVSSRVNYIARKLKKGTVTQHTKLTSR